MGWTLWALQFRDDEWRRVPHAWYDRLIRGQETVDEPEGTLLRFAQVSIELEDREPIRLGNVWFVVHQVDKDGAVNQARERDVQCAAAEMAFGHVTGGDDAVVIPATHRFARKRYQDLGTWEPTVNEEMALMRLLRSYDVPC